MDFENANFLSTAAPKTSAAGIESDFEDKQIRSNHLISTSSTVMLSAVSPSSQLNNNVPHLNETSSLNDKRQPTKVKQVMSDDERTATKKSLVILAAIFISSIAAMCYVYMIFPELDEVEKQHIKLPRDIQDAKQLAKVLDRYKDMYYFEVMFGVIVAYIFLQTFAIPGSLFLSILLGFLYKFPIALFLISFCSSLGATLCYSLSNLVGRRLIKHFWPKKTNEWSKHVEKHRESLFHYMLFLRMTPILPNWFINLASPVIGVPLFTFAFGTFCGVIPPSVIAIQAGKTLQKMTNSSDAFSWTSMGVLTICACCSLLPSLFKNKFKKKIE